MKSKVHPSVSHNETNYVVLKYMNYQLRAPFELDDSTDYLLNLCETYVINKNLELDVPFYETYVTVNGRPLRRGFSVMEFGINNFDSLIINVSMNGGYQLYTHIQECESYFEKSQLQTGFSTSIDIRFQFVVILIQDLVSLLLFEQGNLIHYHLKFFRLLLFQ